MKRKSYWNIIIFNILFILGLASIIFIVDPYQRYRKPFYGKTVSIEQTALNPELLKNQDYDSLILGSSMSQNFSSKQTNKFLDGKFLNVSIGGAQAQDLKYLFEFGKKYKPIKKVFISLDVWALNHSKPSLVGRYNHLYTFNYFKDYKYLLSAQSYLDSLKILVKPAISPYDLTYDGHKGIYSKENAILTYKAAVMNKKENKKENSQLEKEKYFNSIKSNLDNTWISMIENNEDIEFIFFFPPYSILTYKLWGDEYSDYMKIKEMLIENILIYSNAKVYDFQDRKDITHDLDNYKDYSHYHPKINSLILNDINMKRNEVTFENYLQKIEELNTQVYNYNHF